MIFGRALASLHGIQCSWNTFACTQVRNLNNAEIRGEYSDEYHINTGHAIANNDYAGHARHGLNVLQGWYNKETGIWDSTNWWNAANCLTVLADYCNFHHGRIDPEHLTIFNNTLHQAPKKNLGETKIIHKGRIHTISADNLPPPKGFLNEFYDDEGWWALAWIRVYDVTSNPQYLMTAATIFEDMALGSSPCGGIWWNKGHTAQVAIANELYLAVAASLANRASSTTTTTSSPSYTTIDLPRNATSYLSAALKQWSWFLQSGLINHNALINDGLDAHCNNNHGAVWTYNQGVILGALVELHGAAPSPRWLNFARSIAHSAMQHLAAEDTGVLTELCEHDNGSCGADGSQFKGVLMRNLRVLYAVTRDEAVGRFLETNARSILREDVDGEGRMSLRWAGPFVRPANASTHSSALDALVAAMVLINH